MKLFKFGSISFLLLCSINSFASEEAESQKSTVDLQKLAIGNWQGIMNGVSEDPLEKAAAKWKQKSKDRKAKIDETKILIGEMEQETQSNDERLTALLDDEQKLRLQLKNANEKLQKLAEEKNKSEKIALEQKSQLDSRIDALLKMQEEQEEEEDKLEEAESILQESRKLRAQLCSLKEDYKATENNIDSDKKRRKILCKRSSILAKVIENLTWIDDSFTEDEQELEGAENIKEFLTSLSAMNGNLQSLVEQTSEDIDNKDQKLVDLQASLDAIQKDICTQEMMARGVLYDGALFKKTVIPVLGAVGAAGVVGACYYYDYYCN